jgi:hypothetical protein
LIEGYLAETGLQSDAHLLATGELMETGGSTFLVLI